MEFIQIITGDCRTVLKELSSESVQCVVTSPPYWGLRDYGHADQIGQEETPDAYVETMRQVFSEIWRVLKDDGTAWLNLGDSYARNGGTPGGGNRELMHMEGTQSRMCKIPDGSGLKPKDLVGIPWRVALALQADGWYLRSDIIWAKANCMPESVTDRPTRSHEYIFLFAKGQWKSRIVALTDLSGERVHFRNNGSGKGADSWAGKFSVALASSVFDSTQSNDEFGLPPLDSEEWQKRFGDVNGEFVSNLPIEHRAAILSALLLRADISTKEFLCKLHGFGITLTNRNKFLIGGCPAEFALPPGVYGYGKTSIRIHDSGKIGEFDFLHGRIIHLSPSSCNYYYDHEAIKEPCIYDLDGTGTAARKARQKEGAKSLPTAERHGIRPPKEDKQRGHSRRHDGFNDRWDKMEREEQCTGMRNKRDVWNVAPANYPEAHFATFPPDLIKPCILAGTKPGDVVLDPFGGSGTTGMVALELGRRAVLVELNPDYCKLCDKRCDTTRGLPL